MRLDQSIKSTINPSSATKRLPLTLLFFTLQRIWRRRFDIGFEDEVNAAPEQQLAFCPGPARRPQQTDGPTREVP